MIVKNVDSLLALGITDILLTVTKLLITGGTTTLNLTPEHS